MAGVSAGKCSAMETRWRMGLELYYLPFMVQLDRSTGGISLARTWPSVLISKTARPLELLAVTASLYVIIIDLTPALSLLEIKLTKLVSKIDPKGAKGDQGFTFLVKIISF